ncbi:MAG: ribosome recycling factor [Candidatus Marinimicrobia bacterium]|nr:ribosome recycling factor [Candidatus Neomarinimicrobiota bacterium]
MLKDIQINTKHRMDQAIVHTNGELAKVRTGRANPDILNSISIDYYGVQTPLSQVSNISIPQARLIIIQPYEKTLIPLIEKAIMENNLGLTPNNNGVVVNVPIPPLSEERRGELIKYVHELIEDGRVSIRNVRRDAIHQIKQSGDDENISEDLVHDAEAEIQKITDEYIDKLNTHQEEKEKELQEI